MDNYKRLASTFGAPYLHSLLEIDERKVKDWSAENLKNINLFLKRDSFCINEKNQQGETVLYRVLSTEKCSLDIIRLLLNYGADVNSRNDEDEDTPLLVALIFKRDEEIIRILLENGANVKVRNRYGATPMCCALGSGYSVDVLKLLLVSGCHPDACRIHGSVLECLSCCSEGGLSDGVLDLLIESRADVTRYGSEGQSPVCLALRAGAGISDIRRLLELGASLGACRKHSSPWLCATDFETEAYEMRHFWGKMWGMPLKSDVFQLFRESGAPADRVNEEGQTPLQLALMCCDYETLAIKVLMDLPGVDFSIKDVGNRNLLHLAAKNFHCKNKQSSVEWLIERGVEVTELNSEGQTPLHVALLWSDIDVISLLVEHGSPVNGVDVNGRCPLSIAVLCHRGFDIIQVLLFSGARIGETSEFDDNSILYFALDRFLENQCQEKLDELKLLVKHSYLENPDFSILRLIWSMMNSGNAVVEELINFASKCSKQVQVMKSKNIGIYGSIYNFLKRCLSCSICSSSNSPSLCKDELNQLLSIMADNDLSLYFELISNKVGKSPMKTKLRELHVYTVKMYADLNDMNEKIYLNYDSLCELIQFLSTSDLLRLILAYAP